MTAPLRPLGGARRLLVVESRRPTAGPEHGWARRYYVQRAAATRYGRRRIAAGWHVRTLVVDLADVRVRVERGAS